MAISDARLLDYVVTPGGVGVITSFEVTLSDIAFPNSEPKNSVYGRTFSKLNRYSWYESSDETIEETIERFKHELITNTDNGYAMRGARSVAMQKSYWPQEAVEAVLIPDTNKIRSSVKDIVLKDCTLTLGFLSEHDRDVFHYQKHKWWLSVMNSPVSAFARVHNHLQIMTTLRAKPKTLSVWATPLDIMPGCKFVRASTEKERNYVKEILRKGHF